MNAITKIEMIADPKLTQENDFVIVSCGLGTNSVALLVECVKRQIKVDLILFADTGAEKPHTYDYLPYFSKWLVSKGYPEIKVVKAPNKSLEQDCIDRKALPSIAYGKFKTCSQRFKIQPQDKFVNNHSAAKQTIKNGGRLVKLIGFDADEPYRADKTYSDKYTRIYPLIEWDMGRDECIQSIRGAGLVLPGKSACYFCPNSKASEIKWLEKVHPELLERALMIEAQADLNGVAGLGRKFSWQQVVNQEDAFMDHFVADMPCDCYEGDAA